MNRGHALQLQYESDEAVDPLASKTLRRRVGNKIINDQEAARAPRRW
jgi:hypothetical protein